MMLYKSVPLCISYTYPSPTDNFFRKTPAACDILSRSQHSFSYLISLIYLENQVFIILVIVSRVPTSLEFRRFLHFFIKKFS